MDAFDEIICDTCHKIFTNKFSLNRHVKTMHEKKEDFTCMKCQKNFKEMLKRHQQKCGKRKRCGAQYDSLSDFAKENKLKIKKYQLKKQESRIENRITPAIFEQRTGRSLRF